MKLFIISQREMSFNEFGEYDEFEFWISCRGCGHRDEILKIQKNMNTCLSTKTE